MKQAYLDKKDLYSVIAQSMYKNRYEDNLEFYPEGTHITIDGQEVITGNKTHKSGEGKARRSSAKKVLLGLLYGRGAFSIAEQLGKPKEEGQKIIDDFFSSFPKVKELIDNTQNKARTLGYVEDWYGRRRHLPDMQLPRYTIEYTQEYKKAHNTFNPILICENRVESANIDKYTQLVQNVRGRKQLNELSQKALSEGVKITDNSGFISRAERQCLNSIVQGGAATLTKLAMVNIYNDRELNELGLRMLVPIHDELLCTCPKINADRASERLVQVMIDTAKPFIDVPMSCDPYLVSHWYWDELTNQVQDEFDDLQENLTKEEAFEKMKEIHSELLENDLKDMLNLK